MTDEDLHLVSTRQPLIRLRFPVCESATSCCGIPRFRFKIHKVVLSVPQSSPLDPKFHSVEFEISEHVAYWIDECLLGIDRAIQRVDSLIGEQQRTEDDFWIRRDLPLEKDIYGDGYVGSWCDRWCMSNRWCFSNSRCYRYRHRRSNGWYRYWGACWYRRWRGGEELINDRLSK